MSNEKVVSFSSLQQQQQKKEFMRLRAVTLKLISSLVFFMVEIIVIKLKGTTVSLLLLFCFFFACKTCLYKYLIRIFFVFYHIKLNSKIIINSRENIESSRSYLINCQS